MVSTRGNPVSENERKSGLPSRESRRSTRGALQEPEDEVRQMSLSDVDGAGGSWSGVTSLRNNNCVI